MPDQVDEQVKQDRADLVMGEQLLRCEEENQTLVGNTYAVLCEGFDVPSGMFFGRSYRDAYDIDGKMYFYVRQGAIKAARRTVCAGKSHTSARL